MSSEMSIGRPSPTADGVRAAARRLEGRAIRTPLIENDALNDAVGGRVLLKAEVLQRGGSFKYRGAFNLIAQLPEGARASGVVAWSSGNHAQGVARAAREFGCPAIIVMPADAPAIKTEMVKALGAEIVAYDRYSEDREAIARAICAERNMSLAPSFDHAHIIEGQGTVALETMAQARAMGATLDAFLICCGGGGLAAGCALILEQEAPDCDVWIAEPEGFADAWESVEAGEIRRADIRRPTICDAIATPSVGELTFPILSPRAKGGAAVSERDIAEAAAFAFRQLKLVVEPGGAAALAALLSRKFDGAAKTTAVTLSGGNVDPEVYRRLLENPYTPIH